MIRVVITGSECTGKTTLAQALADRYRVPCVPEYVRQFVDAKGAPPEYEDVGAIARGQMDLEDKAAARVPVRAAGLIVQDTDLISTIVYSHHYYGDCPRWIGDALRVRVPGLYLLAGIDVPWVPDGDMRDRRDRREEMQELFRSALIERGLEFVEISGSRDERVMAATAAIDPLLGHDRS